MKITDEKLDEMLKDKRIRSKYKTFEFRNRDYAKEKTTPPVFRRLAVIAVAALLAAGLIIAGVVTAAKTASHGIPTPPDVTETVPVPVTDKDTEAINTPDTETKTPDSKTEADVTVVKITPDEDTTGEDITDIQTDPIENTTGEDIADTQTDPIEETKEPVTQPLTEEITTSADTQTVTEEITTLENQSVNPTLYPLEYESISDLREAVNRKNGADIYKEFSEQGATSEQLDKITFFIEKLSSQNNAVPCLDGKMIELRNKEGFTNISLFASEAYGLPCIFYHPSVSTGENYYIKITYLPDEIAGQNDKTVSEIIKGLSPNSPNVNNLGNQHKSIYEQTLNLADREVTALIYEYKNDSRNSTIFVYDDLLVEVRGNPDVWSAPWFSNLSFGSFQ